MSSKEKWDLTRLLSENADLSIGQRLRLVATLSWPAIMAQLSTILMEYIDASMVGSLGASPSASIGLMATTTWLFFGLGSAFATGFSVQVAHLVGARRDEQARKVLNNSILCLFVLGVLLATVGASISGRLPLWLGGNEEIAKGASAYFLIVTLTMPFCYITFLCSSMLRCSGNMLVPGILNVTMCIMDVVFNFFLIFPDHVFLGIEWPGANLGVMGAALGTAAAEIVTGIILMWYLMAKSEHLNFKDKAFTLKIDPDVVKRAFHISTPIGGERIMMCGAQIITTIIVAPLGIAAIAANSFGITAESLCYMPGYGVGDASTTLVGQSLGAGRKDLAKSFGKITIIIGMLIMTIMGFVMWIGAPFMMSLFTPDVTVRDLGIVALRTEAWAEPMFAASIVTYGVMVGAGYTVVPACINLASIWIVRLSLAAMLAPVMGLHGVWLAMCIELCVRGTLFLTTFAKAKWIKYGNVMPEAEIEEMDNKPRPFEM